MSPEGGTVLLVDDEECIRGAGKKALEKLGYSVMLAKTGKKALKICRQRKGQFSFIILDLVMPEMGGEEAFRMMQEEYPRLKVLISSGLGRQTTAEELLSAGAVGFLAKPYGPEELKRAVADALK